MIHILLEYFAYTYVRQRSGWCAMLVTVGIHIYVGACIYIQVNQKMGNHIHLVIAEGELGVM